MNKKAEVKTWASALVLKELRRDSELKQSELAQRTGISLYRISQFETANREPTSVERAQLCAVFDQTPDSLDQRIQKEILILTGEIPSDFSSKKINYFKMRDEENHSS